MPTAAEVDAVGDVRPGPGPAGWARARAVAPGVLVVTLLSVIDVSLGPTVVLAGLTTVGPCLSAIAGHPRGVAAVGAYSVVLLLAVSFPDNLWWTRQQLFTLMALLGVTAVSVWAADRRVRDETRLRAVEAESARARAVSEATGEFLSRVSHELRTPLNAILGFTQLLQLSELRTDQRASVDQVARAGDHLLTLVKDVLDVTAAGNHRLSLSLEPVAVGVAVRDAVELTGSGARERGVALDVDLGPAGDRCVLADAQRLRQILVNLVSNAVKFNRQGGRVAITVERTADGRLSIAVSDNGPGIAADDLAKVFQPFERLDADLRGVEGSGLGLALAHTLAEAMNGELNVVSRRGVGSTFSIVLPEAGSEALPPARGLVSVRQAQPAPPPAEPRVLHVEDNLANQRLVSRLLEKRPAWALMQVGDGARGLELALSRRFDLILIDQGLTGVPGLSVLREMREHAELAHVPVVILSAESDRAHHLRALEAGATDYLVEPFTVEAFLAVLDAHAPVLH